MFLLSHELRMRATTQAPGRQIFACLPSSSMQDTDAILSRDQPVFHSPRTFTSPSSFDMSNPDKSSDNVAWAKAELVCDDNARSKNPQPSAPLEDEVSSALTEATSATPLITTTTTTIRIDTNPMEGLGR